MSHYYTMKIIITIFSIIILRLFYKFIYQRVAENNYVESFSTLSKNKNEIYETNDPQKPESLFLSAILFLLHPFLMINSNYINPHVMTMLIFGAYKEDSLLSRIPRYYDNMDTKYWIMECILATWHHLSFYVSYTYPITLFIIWLPHLILGLDYFEIDIQKNICTKYLIDISNITVFILLLMLIKDRNIKNILLGSGIIIYRLFWTPLRLKCDIPNLKQINNYLFKQS